MNTGTSALSEPEAVTSGLLVRQYGRVPYVPCWQDMQAFTSSRTNHTADELWLLEHPPVFTLGRNTKSSHLHDTGEIPVVQVDRGGQVTYHGPGQLVAYTLIDLKRRRLGVQSLVRRLEQSVIDLLSAHDIPALRRKKAPGVYVEGRKIAALGLRVRRGCSYHGISLNVDMDLTPFNMINPCGYKDLEVTQLADFGVRATQAEIALEFRQHFERQLNTPDHE